MNTKALLEPMGSWAWWRSWFLIFLGCSIMGAGFVLFVNPYNFVPGGVYGMGIVLHNIFPSIQVGTFGYMFDVPLMLTAMLVFGGQFGTRTVLAALYTPGFMNVLTRLVYPDAAAVESLDLGTGDAASNGWMLTLYSLITIYITSRVIAYLLNGASYDKLLFIISDHHEQLKRFIIEDLDRSATYIKSKGMYTDALRDMIFLVVSRKEVRLVQHKIKEIDPSAFVVVTDAYETFGEGFKQFPDKNEIHAE